MATPNIVPRADSEGGLGTASKYWASAYIDTIYVGAGSIGRDADNLIDFSTDNLITFKVNGASELRLDGSALFPRTSDGLSLGYSSYRWSDLFLADGAVINFDGGEVTMTHSGSGDFTIDAADDIRFDAGGGDIVLRAGGTEYGRLSNSSGDFVIKNITADKDVIFQADNGSGTATAYLTLDGSAGYTTVQKDIHFAPGIRAYFGSGGLLSMLHDNSNGFIINDTGDLTIQQNTNDGAIIFKCDDGSGGTTEYFKIDGNTQYMLASKNIRFLDGKSLKLGTAGDAAIQHNGTDTFIENYTGDLKIISNKQDKDIIFQGDDGQASDNTVTTYFYLDGSSATHDGSATTNLYTNWPDNSRISLGTSHDLDIHHGGTNSFIQNQTGDLYIINRADGKDIIFQSDDGSGGVETYFFLDGSAGGGDPATVFPDNSYVHFGSGFDLNIGHSGSAGSITNNTGDLTIKNTTHAGDIIFQTESSGGTLATYFQIDGGITKTTFSKDTKHLDTVKGLFGTNDDLQIYHDGSHSYIIDNGTGNLWIGSNGGSIYLGDEGASEIYLQANDNGSVSLYHDNSKKFETTATGATVTGILGVGATSPGTINSVAFSSVGLHTNSGTLGRTITEGSNSAEFIMNDSGASADERAKFIQSDSGVLSIGKYADNGTATAQLSISNSGDATFASKVQFTSSADYIDVISGDLYIVAGSGKKNILYSNNTEALRLDESQNATFAGALTVGADDTGHDVIFYGATSSRYLQWDESQDSLRLRDNVKMKAGNDGDLEIYHDGSNSYIKDGGTGNLNIAGTQVDIMNVDSSEYKARFLTDGAVILYHDAIQKFATSSAGVDVTGDVSITSTAASAVGGGFDGAETVAIQIGEVNQEIITTIQIDLGTGGATDIVSSSTAGDVIGENDTAAAFITKYDSTKNGVLYKAELICLETPAGGDTDINLVLNASSLAEDAAGETEGHVIVDGGAQTIGMRTESTASIITAAAGAHNDYIYLTHGGTTAGTYSAGKFLIRLYGAKATL